MRAHTLNSCTFPSRAAPRQCVDHRFLLFKSVGAHHHHVGGNQAAAQQCGKASHLRKPVVHLRLHHQKIEVAVCPRLAAGVRAEDDQAGSSGNGLLQRLRKDLDFDYRQMLVRDGKGAKDRVTMLPDGLVEPLRNYSHRVKRPRTYALARKYPNAAREWAWQYVFPSGNRSVDPLTGVIRRHHLDPQTIQRAVRKAARTAGIPNPRAAIRCALRSRRISFAAATTLASATLRV